MTRFPPEFSGFIDKRLLSAPHSGKLGRNGNFVRAFPNAICAKTSRTAIGLLEKVMAPRLRKQHYPIPPGLIKDLKHNFTETLPKTFRNQTATLNSPRSQAAKAANEIGLLQMLGSSSLHAFAEAVSGYRLERMPGFQASRYLPGDFIGPHNDHHPEDKHLRGGYIDFQITLTSNAVENQYLIYEHNGLLNNTVNMAIPSCITVAHLPFWHQVTPLIPKKGKEKDAVRWLLMVSFNKA